MSGEERGKEKIFLDAPIATNSDGEVWLDISGMTLSIPGGLLAEAEDRGYRRAVQALRDEAADFTFEEGRDHSFRFAADFLEHRAAAAPRNEGAPDGR